MGLQEHEPTIEYLVDLVVEVQTVRSCLTAAERDPRIHAEPAIASPTTPISRRAASRC